MAKRKRSSEAETVAVEEVEAVETETETETETESTETEETKERRLRGKRDIFFVCSGIVEDIPEDIPDRNLTAGETGMISEQIQVTTPAEDVDFDVAAGKAEAVASFTARFGSEPEVVHGPYYVRKGLGNKPRVRETINQTIAKDAPFTAERGSAIHRVKDRDWKVTVNFTTKKDVVYVFYDAPVNKQKGEKIQKPSAKYLPIKAVTDLRKESASA